MTAGTVVDGDRRALLMGERWTRPGGVDIGVPVADPPPTG